jgi:hypothetical protein
MRLSLKSFSVTREQKDFGGAYDIGCYDAGMAYDLPKLKIKNMNWNPQPTKKSEGIESFLKDSLGVDRRKSITQKVCPFCSQAVTLDSFKDELSLKEFHISGLCQSCQNSIFG